MINKKELIEWGWVYTGQNYADLEIWRSWQALRLIECLWNGSISIYLHTDWKDEEFQWNQGVFNRTSQLNVASTKEKI